MLWNKCDCEFSSHPRWPGLVGVGHVHSRAIFRWFSRKGDPEGYYLQTKRKKNKLQPFRKRDHQQVGQVIFPFACNPDSKDIEIMCRTHGIILLLKDILQQLCIYSGFYTSQVVAWDFWTINGTEDVFFWYHVPLRFGKLRAVRRPFNCWKRRRILKDL